MIDQLQKDALSLLKVLIETQSFSSEEDQTAKHIENWLKQHHIPFNRQNNNVWATNKHFEESKPTLLLNSHHDTAQPNKGYTKDPFSAIEEDGKLFGLGCNDAGGCLVSLLATFVYFYARENLNYNLVLVASGEEESSGPNGLRSMLSTIPKIDVAIVGEPTQMQMAVAEKGLLVFDGIVKGTPSHAAHPNLDNPIYKTASVLKWFEAFQLEKVSDVLGPVKVTLTQINAGVQHNAVPSEVKLVVDVRVNECYSNEDIVDILQKNSPCDSLLPRSTRLNPSSIPLEHPLVKAGLTIGMKTYGSPTLSDQACLSCPSLKLGPGDSKRSHSADEFIYLKEIEKGIKTYIELLEKVL